MSEAANVRLVRCPRCQNLLPELTDFSVYQCGGCGAVLRAKNKKGDLGASSEKSDEERDGEILEKFENSDFAEKSVMNLGNDSDNDAKSDYSSSSKGELGGTMNVNGSENDLNSNCSSYSRGDRRVLRNRGRHCRDGVVDTADRRVVEDDAKLYKGIDEPRQTQKSKDFESLKYNRNTDEPRRPVQILDQRTGETSETEGLRRAPRFNDQGIRYAEEGPSDYRLDFKYGYEEPLKNNNNVDGFDRNAYHVDDRAELLRKIDELKDQLSRSCDVVDRPNEKIPTSRRTLRQDPYIGPDQWSSGGALGVETAGVPYAIPDKHITGPPSMNLYGEPSSFINRQERDRHRFLSPMDEGYVQRFDDPVRSQMLGRGPFQTHAPLQQRQSHAFLSGRYMDGNMAYGAPYDSYPPHYSSCSCVHCYHSQVPAQGLPTAIGNSRFSEKSKNPIFYHHENPSRFDTQDYNLNPRMTNPLPVASHHPQSRTRWPSDLNSEVGSHVRRRLPRVQLAMSGQHCHPIAHGAPLLACLNCLEVLKIPKNVLLKDRYRGKMRCGACSTIIGFGVTSKGLVSIAAEVSKTDGETDEYRDLVPNKGISYQHGNLNQTRTAFSSDDFDNSGNGFHSVDREIPSLSTGHGSSNKSAEMSLLSSSSSTSDEDGNSVNGETTGKSSNSAELLMDGKAAPPPQGSSLQDYFEYSNKYNVARRFANGNRSERSEPEKGLLQKAASRQSSMKGDSLATEIEISSNEFSNTGTSFDSRESSRGGDRMKTKAAESFFAGIIKKSFKDLSRSSQTDEQEKATVTVNGHLMSDRLIKKAEKQAGPIRPGDYWYDFRAGFWGVMGGPCLGIVPPFIEEFNHPMPENCAGGDTGVFVNGRELHQKDLTLLGSRGLPTERERSYVIEISGRVLDEDSGEELESLGKLAPTVEKVKRGFGMRPPKAAAT